MSTYAAYYNLSEADKAEQKRRAFCAVQLPLSSNVQTERRRSSFQKVLDHFRPYEVVLAPDGVYSPIIKKGSPFSRKSSSSSEKQAKDEK